MKNKDCIFCRIIDGEIPSYKVYEDEKTFAFLDINPLNKGHVLIIPKKHIDPVWSLEDDEIFRLIISSKKIAEAVKKAFSPKRVFSLVLGFDVPHAHMHLVPRFDGDGHGGILDFKNKKEFSGEEMKEIAGKIRENLPR